MAESSRRAESGSTDEKTGSAQEATDSLACELHARQRPEVREQVDRQAMDVSPLSTDSVGKPARGRTDIWQWLVEQPGSVVE